MAPTATERRAMLAPALALHDLRFGYGTQPVLTLDHFTVAPGQSCAVLGPSGCGKTTLLHLIAGLLTPTGGRVQVTGQDLAALTPAARDRFRGRQLGIVFQRLHLLPALTVLQNLLLAQRLAGVPQDAPAACALLDRLGVRAVAQARPSTLSQGQAQRVAIARAVLHRPALLLADEPTSHLDDANAEAALVLLQAEAKACGAALLVVTHDARVRGRLDGELRLAHGARA